MLEERAVLDADFNGFLRVPVELRDPETLLIIRVEVVGGSDGTHLEFLSAKKVDKVCRIGLKSKPGCQPVQSVRSK